MFTRLRSFTRWSALAMCSLILAVLMVACGGSSTVFSCIVFPVVGCVAIFVWSFRSADTFLSFLHGNCPGVSMGIDDSEVIDFSFAPSAQYSL